MKKETSDAIDAQLRAEPDYKDLCKLLDKQSDAQKARLAYELTQSQRCEQSQDRGVKDMKAKTRAVDTRIMELHAQGMSFSEIADRLHIEGLTNHVGGTFTKKSVSGRYYRIKDKPSSQGAPGCDDTLASQDSAKVARLSETGTHDLDLAKDANGCEELLGITLEEVSCEPSQPGEDTEAPLNRETLCEDAQTCDDNQTPAVDSDLAKHGEDSQYGLPSQMIAPLRKLIRDEIQAMGLNFANYAKDAKPHVDMPPVTPRVSGSKKLAGERATLPGCRVDKVLADAFEAERRNVAKTASALMQQILWLHFGKPRLSFEEDTEE
jgi:hypothetical protein